MNAGAITSCVCAEMCAERKWKGREKEWRKGKILHPGQEITNNTYCIRMNFKNRETIPTYSLPSDLLLLMRENVL